MRARTARKIVAILVSLSCLILLVSGAKSLLFNKNTTALNVVDDRKANSNQAGEKQTNSSAAKGDVLNKQVAQGAEIDATQATDKVGQFLAWPTSSVIDEIRKIDMKAYRGRGKKNQPLKGISVFLMLPPDGVVSMQTAPQHVPKQTENQSSTTEPQTTSTTTTATPTDVLNDFELSTNTQDNYRNSQDVANKTVEGQVAPTGVNGSKDLTMTQVEDVVTTEISVCASVANKTKALLEEMGATVKVIGDFEQAFTDKNKAAQLGSHIITDFANIARQSGLDISRINQLKPALNEWESGISVSEAGKKFYADMGVTKDQRLLLDIEKQYPDYVVIDFSTYDNNSEARGISVSWLGQAGSAGIAQYDAKKPQLQPLYNGYVADRREKLAQAVGKSISSLLPDLASDNTVAERQSELSTFNNLPMINVVLGRLSNPIDGKILVNFTNRDVIAEAISTAIYQYYCE